MLVTGAFTAAKFMISVWAVASSLEWLANRRLFADGALFSPSIALNTTALIARGEFRTVVVSQNFLMGILGLRFLSGIGLIVSGSTYIDAILLSLILLTIFFINLRTIVSGDGSDQMAMVSVIGLILISLGISLDANSIVIAGLSAITGQCILSYFFAGAAKIISPIWRSGQAIVGVMSTQTYGHRAAFRIASERHSVALMVVWIVMISEICFPLLFFLPEGWMVIFALCCFGFFHVVNAVFMGLNLFVISFISTYPIVYFSYLYLRGEALI